MHNIVVSTVTLGTYLEVGGRHGNIYGIRNMEYGIWKGNAFCGALWYGRCITWSPRNVLRDEWGIF